MPMARMPTIAIEKYSPMRDERHRLQLHIDRGRVRAGARAQQRVPQRLALVRRVEGVLNFGDL